MLPEYVKKHVVKLKSVSDGEDFSDLQPLKKAFKNARIIGLGESTHGTAEFFKLKHRITRFLVEEMGFRTFAIEAGVEPCKNINDYVTKGKGERSLVLASQGYWTWDTYEVSDMLDWMHEHNKHCARGDEISFIGYDIKPIDEACGTIMRILKKTLPQYAEKVQSILDAIQNIPFPCNIDNPPTTDGILWVIGLLENCKLTISKKSGRSGFDLAMDAARIVWQYMDGMVVCNTLDGRDTRMADNLIRQIDAMPQDAKVVVWAHNYHISKDHVNITMGELLSQRYGDQYFPCALSFTEGSFQSRLIPGNDEWSELGDLQEFSVGKPHHDFWERDLMEVEGDFFVDLREARCEDEETLAWSNNTQQLFGAGGGYMPLPEEKDDENPFFEKYAIGKSFDGLFHIAKTTRANPTPTGERRKGQASK